MSKLPDKLKAMNFNLHFLQPLLSPLSAVLLAVMVDMLLRLVPQARDRIDPLLGIPARFALRFEKKLNRKTRGKKTREMRGVITLVLVLIIGMILAVGIEEAGLHYQGIEPLFWFVCFRLTFPWTATVELLKAWKHKKAAAEGMDILERRRISILVPTKNPDRHAVARMVIEASAVSLHNGFLSAVLWGCVAALFGHSAIAVAVFVTVLLEAERVIVSQENADTPFAQPFQLIEAIINFVPARVAALFWALGAFFTPGASPNGALACMFNQSDAHRAVNAGWPVASVAGALNIALPGGKKRDGWIGRSKSTAKAGEGDVQRVLWLHVVTVTVTVLVLTAVLILSLAA